MSTRCIEFIAFTIKPECLPEFTSIKAQVAAEAHDLPGLITSTTQRSQTDAHQFVDTMVWESREHAVAGLKAFESLPTTPKFLSMMTGPPVFAGHFAFWAGDDALALV